MRILYIQNSLVPPPLDLRADRFSLLSESLEGDVLQPVWLSTPEEVETTFGPGSYPVYTVGRFGYHWFLSHATQTASERLAMFRFYIRKARELHRERPFDCIVAYSHMMPGVIAAILKLLTGARLIIEIATTPEQAYLTSRPLPSWSDRLLHQYSNLCLHFSVGLANRAHFLYPNHLGAYRFLRQTPNSVFHDFVPVSTVPRAQPQDSTLNIVLVGAPWFLKGADILIRAFHQIAPEFPEAKLQILGHFPNDKEELLALTNGSPKIEILRARPNPETLQIISQAAVLVLPSRCEGMGRVLIEAMAAGIPVVGSKVGGIPFMIQHGDNGFLFPCEDVQALADILRRLLTDPGLRRTIGEHGYQRAHQHLNEAVYVEHFTRMVEDAVRGNP